MNQGGKSRRIHLVKTIAILGGGFAGLRSALTLSKKLRRDTVYRIILIDERPIHLYTPDLYEISTAYHDEITEACLTQLKDAVAIPFQKIIKERRIEFLRDRVTKILPGEKRVALQDHGVLAFDYLVVALGSVVNYYGIPGLEEYASPLKTLLDGLAINCHLDMHFHNLWKREVKKEVHIVVGGGGATGVEFASELPGCIHKLSGKYNYPIEKIHITLLEGSGELTGQGEKVTNAILKRFQKLGVNVCLNTFIKKIDPTGLHVQTPSKEKKIFPTDLLIWTGGVKPNPLIRESFQTTSKNGALTVNEYLQSTAFPFIFAAGDNAYFIDSKDQKPAPMLAQIAFAQGKLIAENILAEIIGKKKKVYRVSIKGIIIPLGGKYALLKKGRFVIKGYFMWVLRRLVDLRYALSILPFRYALKKWIHDTNIFVGND